MIQTYKFFGAALLIFTVSANASVSIQEIPESQAIIRVTNSSSLDVKGGTVNVPNKGITKRTVSPTVFAYSATGYEGENVKLESYHSYRVVNYFNRSQTYEVEIKIYTSDGSHYNSSFAIQLGPYQSTSGDRNLFLYKYYGAPGKHLLYAYTRISGGLGGYIQGSNSITIYPKR